jgi:hypothetical protein
MFPMGQGHYRPQFPPLLIETTRYDRFGRNSSMKSRGASPCQREGRQFEPGLVLQVDINPVRYLAWRGCFVWGFTYLFPHSVSSASFHGLQPLITGLLRALIFVLRSGCGRRPYRDSIRNRTNSPVSHACCQNSGSKPMLCSYFDLIVERNMRLVSRSETRTARRS